MQKRIKPAFILIFNLIFIGLLIFGAAHKQAKVTPKESQTEEKVVQKKEVTPKPQPEKSQKDKTIESYLVQMTLEEKVGQLFFARVPETNQLEDIQIYHLGGYLLFGRDFEGQTLESIKTLTDSYQSVSHIPLLIGSDEEGGTVTRISQLLDSPFQSPMTLYQAGGLDAIVSDTKQKAELLRSVGIQTSLSPVADVTTDPNAFIYYRTIGQDAKQTSNYISTVVKTMKDNHLGSTLKHFPGYGSNGDSHTDIIYDNRSLEDFRETDFMPFEAGIKAGADSVLVTHNIVTAIDDVPASISPKVTKLLREDLRFDGVIMTDDFDMAGLANFVTQEDAAYQAIVAGNDFIVSSSYASQIPYLLEKVKTGELTEERINQSVKRILKWKYDLRLLNSLETETN